MNLAERASLLTDISAALHRLTLATARIEVAQNEVGRDLITLHPDDLKGLRDALSRVVDRETQFAAALEVALRFGQIDGAHHRVWVIDQMVRALLGDRYAHVIREHNAGEDGPDTYSWDTGIAP